MTTMKQFRLAEAKRLHLAPSTIAGRIFRGLYPNLRLRRKNKRVVFVKIQPTDIPAGRKT